MSGRYRTVVADPPWPYRDGSLPDHGTGWTDRERRLDRFLPYNTLSIDRIASLPVTALAAPAAHVYLWTTNRYIWDARPITESWGVKVAQVLTWCKAPMGLGPGSAFANTTEFVLYGRFKVGPIIGAARIANGMGRADLHRSMFTSVPTGIVYRWEADDCLPTSAQWDQLRQILPALAALDYLTQEPKRQPSSWFQWPRGKHSAKPEAFIDMVEQASPPPYVELFARRQRLGWDSWGLECHNTANFEVPA